MKIAAVFLTIVAIVKSKEDYINGSSDTRKSVFSYSDIDELGPLAWGKNPLGQRRSAGNGGNARALYVNTHGTGMPNPLYDQNWCTTQWLSPINIITNKALTVEPVRDREDVEEAKNVGMPETLIISVQVRRIQDVTWLFDQPSQYHGVIIRSDQGTGALTVQDNFDPVLGTNAFTAYYFLFIGLFYCDVSKAPSYRTMHQIDGQRYPIEMEFVFGRSSPEEENLDKDEITQGLFDNKQLVIVSVLGEIGDNENLFFKPVVDAAGRFHGRGDDSGEVVTAKAIQEPWSPTWLLPAYSRYYYYDRGSFPVPPCWKVERYYVLKEPFKISKEQLDRLTKVKTDLEKSSRLRCAHSTTVSKNKNLSTGASPVMINVVGMEVAGEDDGVPLDQEQREEMKIKFRKREALRSRLYGGNTDSMNSSTEGVERMCVIFYVGICMVVVGVWNG